MFTPFMNTGMMKKLRRVAQDGAIHAETMKMGKLSIFCCSALAFQQLCCWTADGLLLENGRRMLLSVISWIVPNKVIFQFILL